MNLSNNGSFRHLGRLLDTKPHENGKRIFGRDITNYNRKPSKNMSIYEKLPVATKPDTRVRSQSTNTQEENLTGFLKPLPQRDNLEDYKQDVMNFIITLQRAEPKNKQKQISDKMRYILIDWLIDVHQSFELKQQTLYLALSYLARYSGMKEISKEDYQLAGIACLWVASKYEEIYPPRTRNYIEVTADTYSLRDLRNMQSSVLEAISFDLNHVTPLHLLQAQIQEKTNSDAIQPLHQKAISLCKFAIESALFEGLGRRYDPSTLVSSAIHLAESSLQYKFEIKNQPDKKADKLEVMNCFKEMCVSMQQCNKNDLSALRRKFYRSKYHQVAKMQIKVAQ